MILLMDAGNTRIKWALVEGNEWLRSGVLPVVEANRLPEIFPNPQAIREIWVSNVAGEQVARQIRNIGAGKLSQPHFIAAREVQCGVRNAYSDPSQLGSDRWAALIAAWHLVHGECMVVNCGTAITIDTLSADGEFVGGLILPGIELMQRTLVAATDRLKSAPGKYAPFPQNTADALYSGAIQACCGAIERQYSLLDGGRAALVLSGGAADLLSPYLEQGRFVMPPHVEDNLVLQGLLLARETERN